MTANLLDRCSAGTESVDLVLHSNAGCNSKWALKNFACLRTTTWEWRQTQLRNYIPETVGAGLERPTPPREGTRLPP